MIEQGFARVSPKSPTCSRRGYRRTSIRIHLRTTAAADVYSTTGKRACQVLRLVAWRDSRGRVWLGFLRRRRHTRLRTRLLRILSTRFRSLQNSSMPPPFPRSFEFRRRFSSFGLSFGAACFPGWLSRAFFSTRRGSRLIHFRHRSPVSAAASFVKALRTRAAYRSISNEKRCASRGEP